jgi:glycosyltransferase involved in cell wall biosynthesis
MQIIPALNSGGAQRVCVDVACGLDPSQFESMVLTLEPLADTYLERLLHASGIRVISLEKRSGTDPRMFWRLLRVARRYKPEILHTHQYVLPYVAPVRCFQRIPCLHTVHSLAEKDAAGLVRFVNFVAFRSGTVPVGISGRVRESIDLLYHPKNIPLIPNGIDVRPFRNTTNVRARWRRMNGFAEEDLLIVSVGRLSVEKNFSLLLSVFAELSRKIDNLRLIIAGDGNCRDDLQRRIEELHISDRARLIGERSDIAEMLISADLYITTSLWEGNPLSVMEAMAAGLPIVASRVGGIPDLIDHDVHGMLLAPNDQKVLVHSVADLINSPFRMRKLGDAARAKAFETMDVAGMVRGYERLYIRALNDRVLKSVHHA